MITNKFELIFGAEEEYLTGPRQMTAVALLSDGHVLRLFNSRKGLNRTLIFIKPTQSVQEAFREYWEFAVPIVRTKLKLLYKRKEEPYFYESR